MDITLYYCPNTRAVRIRWLLEELNLPYKIKHINIFSGDGQSKEYRAIHPYGQVPAIKIDDEIIFESGAICNVLADRTPDKKFAPKLNTKQRAQYEQWMFFTPATLEPPIFHYLLHTELFPLELRIPEIAEWNLKNYRQVLITLEKVFKQQMQNSDYLIDNNFGCTDIMIGSVLFWVPEIVAKYPRISRYTEKLKSRTAYQRALQFD